MSANMHSNEFYDSSHLAHMLAKSLKHDAQAALEKGYKPVDIVNAIEQLQSIVDGGVFEATLAVVHNFDEWMKEQLQSDESQLSMFPIGANN